MSTPNTWLAGAWVLTGPTASGKSDLGIELARRSNAEIISLDSMAVYRGLDIGTAKPTSTQRTDVRHHLIDMVAHWRQFSVADYLRLAEQAAGEIRARGKQVLFVGGTPLYLKGLLRGLFDGPPADAGLRRELAEVARTAGTAELHRQLTKVDPVAAGKLHPNDARRLIRALEVFAKTGQPISRWQTQFDAKPRTDLVVWSLAWPRGELHRRIERRVDAMFAAGWVEEVQRLMADDRPLSPTALQAVGYAEIIQHVQGHRDLEATRQLVAIRTRQFAKRQETWFRSLAECRVVDMSQDTPPTQLASQLLNGAK